MKKKDKKVNPERIKEIALEHQLEEWKILNQYVNEMDISYQHSMTIFISVFAIIATVLSNSSNEYLKWGIFIIPLGLIAFFSYVSYQFRITAILRGHLAAIEEEMNKKLSQNIHMWNSSLMETFMAHNNLVNKLMMLPILGLLILIIGYCIKITYFLLIENDGINFGVVWFFLYWIIIIIFILIVFIPFLQNENVRYETFHEDKVYAKYLEYKSAIESGKKEFIYEDVIKKNKIERNTFLKSIGLFLCVAIAGFGVLNIFWLNFSGDKALKGLYDYYAATIGDGVCLPILIGAGYYFCTVNKWKECSENWKTGKVLVNVLASIAIIIAILIQCSWLLNDSIELNWTIERLHHFNGAGWYHAIYFVIMFWAIVRVFVKSLILYIKKEDVIFGEKSYILMWVSACGYFYMHIMDDWLNQENYLFLIIVSTGVFILAYCFFKNVCGYKRSILLFIITVCLMALLVCYYCAIGGLEWSVLQMFEKIIWAVK